MVRVLMCGDRLWDNSDEVNRLIDAVQMMYGPISCVIEGGARGADAICRVAAKKRKIQVETYEAEWDQFGHAAGPIRNRKMLKEGRPDLVVAFHSNIEQSKGTKNMVALARKAGITTIIVNGEE